MSFIKVYSFFFFFLFFLSSSNAQVQALFNDKVALKTMGARWELDSTSARGTFLVTPYKSIYVLPFVWSSSPNEQPHSGNDSPVYVTPAKIDYDVVEMKFQLSFKTKILQSFLWGSADLWVAYTQISHWQIYNADLSRPFREINYEPEIILNFPVKFNVLGFKARMLGLSFDHESNGKSYPSTRSWNRVIFMAGLERKNWNIYIRPWYVIPESNGDNPDISDYIGNADVNVIYSRNRSVFTFIGSHNFNFEGNMRGSSTFSWAYPIKGNLRGYLQVSHGYGNSLIDYNHNQTTIGVGVSLIEWQ
ncbi:phospholipase A [Flavobacterium sp. ZT3R18]|uniref:phospholipase A n=1 Tax=Flavobacterium sp. ZT3R18 TaxID=2594429 RepID=UPI00117B18AC|nr:phospholipase A [Flavobacterium sp. ZT3R18]TRX35014.1 phospholipase A [Flavobacterium sp. ZT3R18]